jgi:hypothetical protein
VKGTTNARNLKSSLQLHSLQLNGEMESYIYKKSYTGADDNSVAAEVSVRTFRVFLVVSSAKNEAKNWQIPVQVTMMKTERENFI